MSGRRGSARPTWGWVLSKELCQNAMRMLTERLRWEEKQRLFYRMRHDGLPRLNKPFPTAADAHYPEIDMAIRRLKPFWVGQVTSGDRLCTFASMERQLAAMNDAAADFFHFEVTQRTEFLRKLRVAIDTMLLTGRGILKVTVDPLDKYRLVIEAVHPMYLIMPQEAKGFEDADEFIHVRVFTVAAYKRLDQRYDTTPETIGRIRGNTEAQAFGLEKQDKRLREGIAYTRQKNGILLYEHYTKTAGGWTVNTYSPNAPELALRKPYGLPYKMEGKPAINFFSFQMEVKDEGWYAPRGMAELLAPVEQYLTKLWNEKADFMTFSNKPIFTAEKEIPNMANFRWQPGEFIPGNVKGVQSTVPGLDFNQEINFARQIGEQQSQSPDFGITEQGPSGGKARTATENNRISALQSAGSNDNGMLFREDLTPCYKFMWALLCQFRARDLTYYAAGEAKTLPAEAMHDRYLVAPDGSPEGWNRIARFQKAVTGMQTFAGNPNVDMEQLTREALTAWDGRLGQSAFVPTNEKGASEYEDEVIEINAMLAPSHGRPSFPAQVKASEDHATRIKACLDWLHACGVQGVPLDPPAQQRVQQHIGEHFQMLKQQNPAAAKQVEQLMKQAEAAGSQPQAPAQAQPGGGV